VNVLAAEFFRVDEQPLGSFQALAHVELGAVVGGPLLQIEVVRPGRRHLIDDGAGVRQCLDAALQRGAARDVGQRLAGEVILGLQPRLEFRVLVVLHPLIGVDDGLTPIGVRHRTHGRDRRPVESERRQREGGESGHRRDGPCKTDAHEIDPFAFEIDPCAERRRGHEAAHSIFMPVLLMIRA